MVFSPIAPVFRRTALALLFLSCAAQPYSAFAQSSHRRARDKSTPTPTPTPTPTATPSPSASPAAAYVLPDPVATVDGDPIHKDELERTTNALLANKGRSTQSLSDVDKKRVYQSVLADIITDRLINREVAGETVDPVAVEKRFDELRAQYPTQEAFDAELKKTGQTSDQVRAILRTQIAQQQWIEHQITDKISLTPEEVEKFYKEGPPSKFDAPEMVRASHILIAVRSDAPPEDALDAENKANDIEARLKKGESFAALAKEYSADPNAKTEKDPGDLGYFSRERIMPEFADAAFKLKVGEISPPVRTQFGYHIIKVTERKAAHTATFAEAREQISAYLQDEKRRDAVAKLVQSLRSRAKIENFIES